MHQMSMTVAVFLLLITNVSFAQQETLLEPSPEITGKNESFTDAVQACYRVFGEGSVATAILIRDENRTGKGERIILLTSGHVLERIKGDYGTLALRKKGKNAKPGDEGWVRVPKRIRLRRLDGPRWTNHPKEDLVAMFLSPKFLEQVDFPIQTLPLSALATKEDWKKIEIEPGDIVRCIGYPHAGHIDTSPAGFPLVRIGSLASYPFVDAQRILLDYNIFEGDSGGAVVYKKKHSDGKSSVHILGVIQGQHFIDERYNLIYQSGKIRKRLGLAITINSRLAHEVIDLLYDNE